MSAQANHPTGAAEAVQANVARAFEQAGLSVDWSTSGDGMATAEVFPESAFAALSCLRNQCQFESNTLVTAVDHASMEDPERATDGRQRFELVWQLLSMQHNQRIRLTARVDLNQAVPSCASLWPGANYFERECYDMFGIEFSDHPDLRRLLMPEEYEHFPLRKDFPHEGIEPDRLYREWDERRRAAAATTGDEGKTQ